MKILLFHPTLLPPKNYGGVERVVLWLARGLIERGHEVWIGAYPGSRLPPGVRLLEVQPEDASAEILLKRLPSGMEIVHFMAPPETGVLEGLPCPGVLTIHGNGKSGETFPVNTIFLSQDHAKRHGAQAFVYNGIDPEEYVFDPKRKEDWFLFLSKTSWRVKNVGGAIRYCRKARASLRVAGGHRPWLERAQVLFTPGMRWVGPVDNAAKADLLARARGFIFPVLWSEPFGLVVVEALISGTPVMASRRGSLPELVPPEVGALLTSDEDWIQVLQQQSQQPLMRWEPERCREWAMSRFHYRVMAEAYEVAYRRVIGGEKLNSAAPKTL